MVISFLQILQESVEKLLPGQERKAQELPYVAIGAMAGTVIIKGIIGIGCWPIKTTQVQALAQDCKTDVYFNTLSLLFPLIGAKADVWWLDPVGAGLLSLFIIYDWAGTCFENVTRLSGQAADEAVQKKLMYLCYRFSPVVDGFKSITTYHAGDGIWVEIDILLDGNTKLQRSHDVAETLQYCAEGLAEVDRAFVSVDCKFSCLELGNGAIANCFAQILPKDRLVTQPMLNGHNGDVGTLREKSEDTTCWVYVQCIKRSVLLGCIKRFSLA